MKDYNSYVQENTEGFNYLTDIGDYDVYQNENTFRAILHQNIVGWENDRFYEITLTDSETADFLEDIEGFDNDLEISFDPENPEALTDRDFWLSAIQETLGV